MKKIVLNSMLVVAAVAMVSCSSKQTTKQQEEVVVALPKIEAQTVVSRMVSQEGYFTGTVEAQVVNNIAPQQPLRIKEIKVDLYAKYDTATAAGYLTKLKSFIRYGMDNNKIKVNPFQGVKIIKGKKDIVYLTEDELQAIYDADIVNANGIRSNLLKNAKLAKIALDTSIIFKLGKKPLCLRISTYSLDAKNTTTKTNSANHAPPAIIANNAGNPTKNAVATLFESIIRS